VLVIGLDGVPCSLVRRFVRDGTMPVLGDLVARGSLSEMTASLPEISSVSWSSFMTGENPGVHGIFGFVDLEPGSYDVRFPSFGDLAAPTFWDALGERGKRCVVVNQPSTYPARPFPGVLVSGFVAIDLDRAVWPPGLARRLDGEGYRIDIDTARCRKDHDRLIEELDLTLRARERAVEQLWGEGWDYFQVVVTGTDRLHHYLWDALEDPRHAYHGAFREYYRKVDAFLGRLTDRFSRVSGRDDPEEGLFLLSDHGFCGIRAEFHLNEWLRRSGYLAWRREEPRELADLASGSRAFALDPGRVYVNGKGRFPRGCVEPGEVAGLREEIRERLLAVEHEGAPVVDGVFAREEAYRGPRSAAGPDLVVQMRRGYDVKGSVRRRDLFGRTDLTGMHTRDDAFFWSKTPVAPRWNITDCRGLLVARVLGEAGRDGAADGRMDG
jgi:predicted AlkP superfamily phosphohydrolase/phosphomutase